MNKEKIINIESSLFLEKVIESPEKNLTPNFLNIKKIGYSKKKNLCIKRSDYDSQNHLLVLCTNGYGWILINNIKNKIGGRDFCLVDKKTDYTIYSENGEDFSIHLIFFDGYISQRIFLESSCKIPQKLTYLDFNEFLKTINEINHLLEDDFSLSDYEYSCIILLNLLKSLKYLNQYDVSEKDYLNEMVLKAKTFMRNSFNQKLTLKEISENSGIQSQSFFSKKFKENTSMTPLQYLNDIRIRTACYLLLNTDNRIKEISYLVGFEDPYYFSRIFSKSVGVSPKLFRFRRKKFK